MDEIGDGKICPRCKSGKHWSSDSENLIWLCGSWESAKTGDFTSDACGIIEMLKDKLKFMERDYNTINSDKLELEKQISNKPCFFCGRTDGFHDRGRSCSRDEQSDDNLWK